MPARRHALCLLAVIPALVLACSSSPSSAPTAPTAATAPSGSTIIDLGVTTPAGTPGAGVRAPVVGTIADLAGTCPEVTFVLSGVTVQVTSATTFENGASCADLRDGVRAGAIGAKNANGVVVAARVKVGATTPPPPPHVAGLVVGLTGSCPALTFSLSGTTVTTSASTLFEGGACADVKEGVRASASGPKDASGAIAAAHVKIPPPPPPHASGVVSALSGACPAVTFTLGTTIVHTTDKTIFDGGPCSDIKEGVRAGAFGPSDANGAIVAEHVKLGPPPMPGAAGIVASTEGTCPALTFVINNPATPGASTAATTVRVNSQTRFEGGSCTDIKAGVRVGARGPKAADGSIDAQVVRIASPK